MTSDEDRHSGGVVQPNALHPAKAIPLHFIEKSVEIFTGPARWFREKVVEPGRPDYPWYHRRYTRVPTVDQCFLTDYVCREEATAQFKRDKHVEQNIVNILSKRWEDCIRWNYPSNHDPADVQSPCHEMKKTYDQAALNYYIKYGDLAWFTGPVEALMKQKHRMIWERRHGPVGSGTVEGTPRITEIH